MAGMRFEYDEEGGTFYYFLLSFVALILFPATYYLWPRHNSKDDLKHKNKQCHCDPCEVKKRSVQSTQPRKNFKQFSVKLVLIIGWIFFICIAYKTSQVELDFKEFDPYAELEIDRGAEVSEIKKAYRRLSLIYHPDRETGDSHRFMRITKAHDALTDEEARKNWEEYGNPDGPGATQVGIALPKWIVEKQNSIWVLGLYALIFMIILPVCIGTWWYRSIKYSAQQVLIDTTRLYYSFLRKSPNMILKRVIMVLSASYEFSKRFNSEIVERPSDNIEIPEVGNFIKLKKMGTHFDWTKSEQEIFFIFNASVTKLIRDLQQFIPKNRELPFSLPYAAKSRALLISHFQRKELPSSFLEIDRQYILKKCPMLLNEMLSLAQQLYYVMQAERVPYKLSLDTVENIMKTSQMVVQGLWCHKSPLLQLPHITEDMLRHFVTKRRNIRSIKQFCAMKDEDRRALLRQLTDTQYQDVMNVCVMMPTEVDMEIHCEVKGEEDKTVTAGAVVTMTVKLTRRTPNLVGYEVIGSVDEPVENGDIDVDEEKDENEEEEEDEEQQQLLPNSNEGSQQPKSKVWNSKNKKKKGGAKKTKAKKTTNKVVYLKKAIESAHEETKEPLTATPNNAVAIKTDKSEKKETAKTENTPQSSDDESGQEGGESGDENPENVETEEKEEKEEKVDSVDDEDEWMAFQKETRKENFLETKSKETHLVHCPHYPTEKYEWWWLYLADTKKKELKAGPIQVTTLQTTEEKDLRFTAPQKPGNYQFTVVLRSDSYFGIDQTQTVKLDVKEAKKIPDLKWDDDSEDEEGKKKDESESDASSDGEMSDDED